jgi:hypothetical protein
VGASDSGWLDVDEACRYLGLDPFAEGAEDELEELVADFDIDCEVDDEGNLVTIDPDGLVEPLMQRYERRFGSRPDDPEVHARAVRLHEQQKKRQARNRRNRAQKLHRRVALRRAAR